MPPCALVVGLGNPGERYRDTRHNIGFMAIAALLAATGSAAPTSKSQAQVSRLRRGPLNVLFCMPQTYMNDSGQPVAALARWYRLTPAQVVVIHDDLDFPLGRLRLKVGGGAGGHNGLRSLIAHLGEDFVRLRLGIGRPPAGTQGADYVLAPFAAAERPLLQQTVEAAGAATLMLLRRGTAAAMNHFNK